MINVLSDSDLVVAETVLLARDLLDAEDELLASGKMCTSRVPFSTSISNSLVFCLFAFIHSNGDNGMFKCAPQRSNCKDGEQSCPKDNSSWYKGPGGGGC